MESLDSAAQVDSVDIQAQVALVAQVDLSENLDIRVSVDSVAIRE